MLSVLLVFPLGLKDELLENVIITRDHAELNQWVLRHTLRRKPMEIRT